MEAQIAVMEATSLKRYDIYCPGCGEKLVSGYSGRRDRFNTKCPNCKERLYEYSLLAVECGRVPDLGDLQRRLKSHWDSEVYQGFKEEEELSKAALKLGISWDAA